MHIEPALVLQPSHVASIKMSSYEFAETPSYSIDIELTDAARKELAAVVEGKGDHMRHVTYVVDGTRRGGWQRYEINVKQPDGIPEICRADTFCPTFSASGKNEEEFVQQIVSALKPEGSAPSASPASTKRSDAHKPNAQDAQTHAQRYLAKGLEDRVVTVKWSADGKDVCAVDGSGRLCVWDAASGDQVVTHELGMKMSNRPMAFSADLRMIAISLGEEVSIRRVANNIELKRFKPPLDPKRKGKFLSELAAMAFSPDGSRIAIGSSWVTMWDVAAGDLIHKSRELVTTSCAVTWSGDGKKYAAHTAGYELYSDIRPAEVCVFDSATGRELHTFKIRPHGQYGYDFGSWVPTDYLAFSPDGERIVVASGTRGAHKQQPYVDTKSFVQSWDLKNGKPTQPVPESATAIGSIQFNSDGSLLAMHTDDKLRLWKVDNWRELASLKHASKIISYHFHPTKNVIVTGHADSSVVISKLEVDSETTTSSTRSER